MDTDNYGIKKALVHYLQGITDFIKVCDTSAPYIICRILQIEPSLKLCDNEFSIEAEITSSLKFIIRDFRNKWIKIENYNFLRKAGERYVLIFEKLDELYNTEEVKGVPEDCMQDTTIKKYTEIHRRVIERENLKGFVNDLPSFDALVMGTSDKQPICFRPRNFVQSEEAEEYVKVGEPDTNGFFDITIDDLEKVRFVLDERFKIPLKCKKDPIELELEDTTENTALEPEEKKNYVSYDLGYLVSDSSSLKPETNTILQSETTIDTALKEIPASEEYAEKVNKTWKKTMGNEDMPTSAKSTRQTTTSSSIKGKGKNHFVIEKKEPIKMSSEEFNRYLSWRNFHKEAGGARRKLEFDEKDLLGARLGCAVEMISTIESPLIQSEPKRRKPN